MIRKPPIWEKRPIVDEVAFVRERIEAMATRPLMYAASREAFAIEVWTMLRMLGIDVKAPGFHETYGSGFVKLGEEPDPEFVKRVRDEALKILDEASSDPGSL